MNTRALALLGTALALGVSGSAYAQTAAGGMSPATMTCGDIAELEEGRAEGAVYFVAGYQFSDMGGGITGATGTSAPGAAATTGTATTDSTSAGTDATAGAATGTTGTTGTTGDTTTGDTMTAGTTGTTGTTDTTGAAGMGDSMMASVDFEQIQVDEILSACEDSPERMVSDVLREHSGSASQ
jgi:hypothetical protein